MEPRVAEFVNRVAERGFEARVVEMSESTHTAAAAAAALGCPVEAIVKSLLFLADGEPLLVLASGPNRVDTGALSAALGASVTMADAKSVKAITGYSIGGVPPFGHLSAIRTVLDSDLLALDEVWAAAGTARSVFPIAPSRLAELTSATVMQVN
jgi:prolyl-tRNA editing enzyme YbaK/EbsC (Cys-tRNA(Pro) deacylase)